MTDQTKPDLFAEKNRDAVRKAFRAGRRTVKLCDRVFNLKRAPGKAGKPFISVRPAVGRTPVAQIEIERFGSSKLSEVKSRGKNK